MKSAGDTTTSSGTAAVESEAASRDTSRPDVGTRRMPDHIRKHVIMLRDGQAYLPSAYRVVWFREEHPDWAIVTDMIEGGYEPGWATVRASIVTSDGRVVATGMKTESKGDFPAGWVEKAETGAIGRALALAGYGTQFAPDLNDMETSERRGTGRAGATRHQPAQTQRRASAQPRTIWPGPGLCPTCHAPEGKPHSTSCASAD
jgi:hypothetical protein